MPRLRPFWTLLPIVAVIVVGSVAHSVVDARLRARLMRADPDSIAADAGLTAAAVALARPAYAAHCAVCHGADLKGSSLTGVPDLTDQDWLYGDGRVTDVEQTILYGIRAGDGRTRNLADMPAFAHERPYRRYDVAPLEPGAIRDVAEYLLVAAHKPGDAAAASRGRKIFHDRGMCFDCHEADAQGDSSIGAPNLLDDIWLHGRGTRADIIDTIEHGSAGICPAWAPQLPAVTIRALAVYIHRASRGQPEG
ncbi:MAG: c-type cytochrome [Alphaproteobacteria bacterium]|nr:c-type cytochrome [Alphaproteobacteria bacterium]